MLAEDFGCPHLCAEEAELLRFRPDPQNPYAERLKRYKDIDRYYPGRRFEALTDGIGCTRTFRACLSEYIKRFKPYPFPLGTEWLVALRIDGSFELKGPGAENGQDKELRIQFEFLCFLHVNAFWGRVEELRGCRLADRPLVVEKKDGWIMQNCGKELLIRLSEGREIFIESVEQEAKQ